MYLFIHLIIIIQLILWNNIQNKFQDTLDKQCVLSKINQKSIKKCATVQNKSKLN